MIGRWLNSLGARITFLVLFSLVAAQALGILVFSRSGERDQSQVRTEAFIRQIASTVQIFNAVPDLDHQSYLRGLDAPGFVFRVDPQPRVAEPAVPARDWPEIPDSWGQIESADKRLLWGGPDGRPLLTRYTIAPFPTERNLRAIAPRPRPPPIAPDDSPDDDSGLQNAPPPDDSFERPPGPRLQIVQGADPLVDGPSGQRPPPDGPTNGGFGPGGPGGLRGPPPQGRPPSRWLVSVKLENGEWLNAEQMYEIGLPPWLRTVLYENSVIFALTLLFVVPAIALATKRLTQLAQAADRLGRGEDTETLPESGSTEIRRLTQAFNNMSLRLRRFVQGRTQMLAGISHDLRTPITALKLRTELVDDEENRERMQALIDDMHHLTEATLTLAKDDSFTEKSDKVDVSSLVEGICDDLTDAGIDATADVQRGVHLICRPVSLRRAIRNITENGAKYGKRARIRLEDTADAVRIIVDDDGPGIPENQIEKAFLPFVRLETSRSRETGGSGLGLAITRSIILNHGGEIALLNRPEGGLRAIITLPKNQDD